MKIKRPFDFWIGCVLLGLIHSECIYWWFIINYLGCEYCFILNYNVSSSCFIKVFVDRYSMTRLSNIFYCRHALISLSRSQERAHRLYYNNIGSHIYHADSTSDSSDRDGITASCFQFCLIILHRTSKLVREFI